MANAEDSLNKSGGQRFWKWRSFRILAGIVIFVAVVLICLPLGTRLYLQKWLIDNGADTVTIDRMRLNPFTGVAALEGMNIQKDNKTVFANSTIYLNVGLKNLFGREALLQEATLADVQVNIEKFADGSMRIGSYTIPAPQAENTDTLPEAVEKLEKKVPWILRAQVVNIENVAVHYRQPDLDIELLIEKSVIERFNTDPDDLEGALVLKGSVNNAPVSLDLSTLNVIPQVDIQGKVTISDLPLDDLAEVLEEYLKPFSGKAGINGKVSCSSADKDLSVQYDGLVHLEGGDVGGKGWATKGTINYDGRASLVKKHKDIHVEADGNLQALNGSFAMPAPVINIDNSDIVISGKSSVTIAEKVIVESNASLQLASTTFAMDILEASSGKTSWDGTAHVEIDRESKRIAVRADGTLKTEEPAYSMDVDGAMMEARDQLLTWDGQVEYIKGGGSERKNYVSADGSLDSEALSFSLPEKIELSQKNLNLDGKTEVSLGKDIEVSYQGDLVTGEANVELEGIRAGNRQLTWSGDVGYLLGEKKNQTLTLKGDLAGEDIFTELEKGGLHINQQSLQSKANLSLVLAAEKPSLAGKISLELDALQIHQDDISLLTLAKVSMSEARDNGSGGMSIDALGMEDLEIHSSEKIPVQANVPSMTLSGILSPDLMSATVKRLTIDEPNVTEGAGKTLLARLDSISADAIGVNRDIAVTVDQVSAENGVFLQENGKDPVATMGKLAIGKITYSPDTGFVGNSVEVDSVFANIIRQKTTDTPDKKKEENESASEEAKEKEDPGSEQLKEKTGIPVQIKQVRVTGKSGFKFTDATLARTFMTVFGVKSLEVSDIDLNRPDHPFTYILSGTFDKYSPLEVTGKCAPLAANIFIEQQASLRNYSMQNASPYSIESIGTYFPKGRLDYTSTLKLADARIDMTNNLLFKDLATETVNGALADELNNQLPVSLDLALSMLRDSDGAIDLDVPLQGELSDLKIGLSSIIITALSKGITLAVTPYLAYTALGPTGALVFMGTKFGMKLFDTNLPPLEFETGKKELTEAHEKNLDKVGKKIEKDKKTSYSICGRVGIDEINSAGSTVDQSQSPAQNEAIRRELFKLGESRSLAVKEYLLSNFKIDENRLLICNPGLNLEKGGKPIVEFKQ